MAGSDLTVADVARILRVPEKTARTKVAEWAKRGFPLVRSEACKGRGNKSGQHVVDRASFEAFLRCEVPEDLADRPRAVA